MPGGLGQEQWLLIALAFFGVIGYIAWIRWRDRRWIDRRFGSDKVLAVSFGVNYFGRATEPGPPRRSSGFLLLLPDRLVYRSRTARLEVQIPGAGIARVYPDSVHKGVDLHQSVLKIDYLNADNQRDCVAFRLPYPPQWARAIETTLMKKKPPME